MSGSAVVRSVEGNPNTGKVVRYEDGNPVMIPGSLKAVKAIGCV
jgi:glutamate formiminotransferase/formiminotetrahydrofolate cyclodeaminase